MRKTELVINDIKNLIYSKGYIYALCMIIFEDFHIEPEKLHELNSHQRLSVKEASLLLGFLIQKKIDFSTPDSPLDLTSIKQKTYDLMGELHNSFMLPLLNKMEKDCKKKHRLDNFRTDLKDFFCKGDMFVESIFYSGTGLYDFQYLDFLERKYKYDRQWLSEKKNFHINQTQDIVRHIKEVLHEKSKRVNLYASKEKVSQMIEKMKKKNPSEDWDKIAKDFGNINNFTLHLLQSGTALEKFKQIIKAQGGNPNVESSSLKPGKYIYEKRATQNGVVNDMNIKNITSVARILGAPAMKGSGIYLNKKIGEIVKAGDTLYTLFSENVYNLKEGRESLANFPLVYYE